MWRQDSREVEPDASLVLQVMREIVTLERMHRAFDSGLMEYGMAKAVKKAAAPQAAQERSALSTAA